MRVLITGAEGFTGSHLVEHCLSFGDEVWGTCRPQTRCVNLVHCLDQMTLRIGDMVQPDFIRSILRETHFDVIFHLAAVNILHDILKEPARSYEVNLLGGINLLDAARAQSPQTRIIMTSSAEVYGPVRAENLPVKETHPFMPVSVFAASKAALELATHPFVHIYGLPVVIARPFNYTGPRQRTEFVCSTLAEQIARVENGGKPIIYVGDLYPKRDFSDVRDIIRGYRLLALHGQNGEAYNLASGNSVTIEHVLHILVDIARVKIEVVHDSSRVRETQVLDVCGSREKITAAIGWEPEIPLVKTLRDMLNWHRDQIAAAASAKFKGN